MENTPTNFIEVEGPDGETYEFPAGTPDADIAAFFESQQVGQPRVEPYSGSILPFSKDETGDVSFDSDAGLLGVIKRAVTLPGDVKTGKIGLDDPTMPGRMLEAATVMTPMSPAARVESSVFAPKSSFKTVPPKAPTRVELDAATKAGYQKAADLGLEYRGQAVSKMADDLARSLDEEGYIAQLAPEVHALLNQLRTPESGATIRLKDLDAVRRILGELAGGTDKTKVAAATRAIGAIDDFVRTADPMAAVPRPHRTGPGIAAAGQNEAADAAAGVNASREAARVMEEARSNAAAGFRSDRVTGLEKTIQRRAAAANSGRNTDNTIRQRLTSFIESAKGSRGLSAEEEQAIDDIIFGRPTKNAARLVGNLLGGGGGLGSTLLGGMSSVAGATAMGPTGAVLGMVPPAIGATARGIANHMSRKELKLLDEMIRMRSPLGATLKPTTRYASAPTRESLAKVLAATQVPGGGVPEVEASRLARQLLAGYPL